MKTFIINRYSKDEALNEIHSTGLNQLDSKIKSGYFKLKLAFFILQRSKVCSFFEICTKE